MNVIDCVNPTGMSGYVLDEDGVPIVGASVMVETMYGTSTDFITVPVISQRITNVSIELKKE